jgi:hypothetical protein
VSDGVEAPHEVITVVGKGGIVAGGGLEEVERTLDRGLTIICLGNQRSCRGKEQSQTAEKRAHRRIIAKSNVARAIRKRALLLLEKKDPWEKR